jgi:hypothetical protein
MTSKEKIIEIIIYITGLIGLYGFIAIRFPAMTNLLLKEKVIPEYWENVKYGELYYFNYIKHFREYNLPKAGPKYRHTPKHPKLEDADIIVFGDSFFDFARMKTFPEKLSDSLNKKVFYARYDYPLRHFAENGFQNHKARVLIYESAERYIPTRFFKPHEINPPGDNRSKIRKTAAQIRDKIFLPDDEVRYDLFLTRSYLTYDIYSLIATFKFDAFGYIPSTTPKYSLKEKDPWLFYVEEVNDKETSFYYQFSQEQIDTYCDNIADLANKLKKLYKLDMIFMAIPSKYTIYHKFLNNDAYNNFLPSLYKGLEKRGIKIVKLYEDYVNSEEVLYYGTDTHWNEKGLNIALLKTIDNIIPLLQSDYLAQDSIKTDKTKNLQ